MSFGEFTLDSIGPADENKLDAKILDRQQSAFDHGFGRVVSAHRIDGDLRHMRRREG